MKIKRRRKPSGGRDEGHKYFVLGANEGQGSNWAGRVWHNGWGRVKWFDQDAFSINDWADVARAHAIPDAERQKVSPSDCGLEGLAGTPG